MNETTINNLKDLQNFAKNFTKSLKPGNVICLKGDLGAGKTTLVKYICEEFHTNENVQSPTFNLLLKYQNDEGLTINHFDLYRLEKEQELEDIAFYEEIESTAITFIEWAEKFESVMPKDAIWLTILKVNENSRTITWS